MCLSIIEIVFLIAGIWLLITGKVPGQLFQLMFGRGNYVMAPMRARLLGLLLVSLLPVVIVVSMFLQLVLSESQLEWSVAFEVFYDVTIAICAIVIARRSRQPDPPKPAEPKPDGVVG